MAQETESTQMFRVEIDKEIEDKIEWFTHNYPEEISGWLVGEIKPNLITITDILFPYQEVGGASVDTTPQALIKLRKEYGDKCLSIVGHWHSHNTMGNFWSTTDDTFIKEYMEQREKAIFIVSSKSNGSRLRVEVRNPISMSIDCCEYFVMSDEDDPLGDELREMIEEKVTKASTTVVSYGKNSGYSAYGAIPLRDGDEVVDYTGLEGLTEYEQECFKDDIDRRVHYNKKRRIVSVIGLSMSQVTSLEDFGPSDVQPCGDLFDMSFKVAGKKPAKRIMKDVKSFLVEQDEINNYNVAEDGGY